jgi:hypothetical protein
MTVYEDVLFAQTQELAEKRQELEKELGLTRDRLLKAELEIDALKKELAAFRKELFELRRTTEQNG